MQTKTRLAVCAWAKQLFGVLYCSITLLQHYIASVTMMRLSLSCALLLLPLVASKKTWTLYHAWKGHDFSKRGSITLTLENSVPTLSVENVASATHLPSEDFYQLKLVEDGKEDSYTLTSVPSCQVHRANFRYVALYIVLDDAYLVAHYLSFHYYTTTAFFR